MYTHPKVLQACSFGIPDPKRGESLKLALVLKPGEEMTEDEVREFCKASLSAYKVPRRWSSSTRFRSPRSANRIARRCARCN